MIISDLCNEYNVLVSKQQAPVYGYDNINVPYGLVIDDKGTLISVHPLGDHTNKKPVNIISIPARVPRSSGIAANFLCDTVAYMLGFDAKGKPERALRAFQACTDLHQRILEGVTDAPAIAALAFFENAPQWKTAQQLMGDKTWESSLTLNFVLQYNDGKNTMFVGDCPAVQEAWNAYYDREDDDEGALSFSLISGEPVIPAKIHPKIKGVAGAQSSGASLISFNAPAFCSHGAEQNENAPMSQREAYEYTTALNTLLADRDRVQRIGDDTIVSWAQCGETAYVDSFGGMAFAWSSNNPEKQSAGLDELTIKKATQALAQGRPYDFEGICLNPNEEFHVLALSPNAARLSVRFYLTNTFGAFARNIWQHYRDLEIRRPSYDTTVFLPTWRLLNQTIRQQSKNVKVSSEMAGAVMKAILNGTAYPASLINAIEIRINAERDISPDKAAIIKAYYSRKTTNEQFKEVLQVDINRDSDYVPYVLGRLFSIYEQIQLAAIPGINTTIKDKYFTSASTTPARIFPILGDLAAKHMRKTWQSQGYKVKLEKALGELTGKVGDHYPSRLTLEERGAFQLGYYFENQQRFNKTSKTIEDDNQGADND
ncbi:CRISPR-associated protein, Csd1 family [Bifidobacterium saguini DSM 23967]|uniref:CRISPR-associated protein, Csd1 family n=2 Tax=Bifidobacterium saguini TaxID=762210 RepID=A0A087DA52_9BIFI|nr:type I-C CRISPR-associated protein Cas8c/Csd1 [Bifidobacterium saguini]KFI92402.1 CRISPR-associated protein, Csd1 family [Bifidobacterium saguini DSM 23967]QTB91091.1 type I-C CRISPR-associated protein Cas8c/Csd1 [Bifidobacterium saguini]